MGKSKNDEWLRLFDVVIVGTGKPGFFSERRPLFAVNPKDGTLQNTDNGAPIIPIGEEDLPDDIQVGGAQITRSVMSGGTLLAHLNTTCTDGKCSSNLGLTNLNLVSFHSVF